MTANSRGQVFIDHLDFWSLHVLLRHPREMTDFKYLTRAHWLERRISEAVLVWLNYSVTRVLSPFETREPAKNFVTFNQKLVALGVEQIEPLCADWISRIGLNGDEQRRTARYFLLRCFRLARRNLELLAQARDPRQNAAATVYLQRSGLEPALSAYGERQGSVVRYYRAPFRLGIRARAGFLKCENDLWLGECLVHEFARSLRLISHATVAWFAAWFRRGRNLEIGLSGRFDVLAVTGRPRPTPHIDDLFWADSLRSDMEARILLVHTTALEPEGDEYYRNRIAEKIELGPLLRGFRAADRVPATVFQSYLKAQLSSYRMLFRSLRRGTPPWLAFSLLSLWERTALYEALMRVTDARVAWVMSEGHELNSQALVIAADRVGGLSLGSTWSLKDSPNLSSSNNRNHVTFVWGKRHVEIFRESGALSRQFVLAGYPAMRFAVDRASHLNYRSHDASQHDVVICFYDNVVAVDVLTRERELTAIYGLLLDLIDTRPDIHLMLKCKREEYRCLELSLVDRIDGLIDVGRITINGETADLAAGLAAHIVVGTGAASLALLAAHRGRPAVLYDPAGVTRKWPVNAGTRVRAAGTMTEMKCALQDALCNLDPLPRTITGIDAFTDVRGDERVARFLGDLIRAFRQSACREDALSRANSAYRDLWGVDKVVDGDSKIM